MKTPVPVFVDNLPINTKQKEIESLFGRFGKVVSVHFRSNTGQELKQCTNTNSQLKEAPHLIAFVYFDTPGSAKASMALNGEKVGDKFITVDLNFEEKLANLAPNMKPRNTVVVRNLKPGKNKHQILI